MFVTKAEEKISEKTYIIIVFSRLVSSSANELSVIDFAGFAAHTNT
ncbi:hypothetical protein LEP1GSC191_3486 [Leptospira borgpetersenii serovar Mini str. 201000851]|uniref:Uncharacterized protein n=1 Tax=Leptospira borgpetersenii str. 200801926 TaxID=1193009 RepID=A0ABN0I0W8_LEPBO|nr:hypothetical protein LEP1GSC128_1781 [Leptospira borgpetersenii str. 200801926]EMK11183.1 hypothetical protein LEP1GSC066_0512 [Leptospira sp. serovar Kenya str. Sh9]ENO63267.1 hypothetical protein LEP1GSC191_3486 [Leptospira borgpetersenii serovar Mini str. 201000851]